MFVAPTNRGVFTWPEAGPIHKKDQHGVRHAAVATRSVGLAIAKALLHSHSVRSHKLTKEIQR